MQRLIANSAGKSWSEMAGAANRAGAWRISKSITFVREANWAMTLPKTWSLSAHPAIKKPIGSLNASFALTSTS